MQICAFYSVYAKRVFRSDHIMRHVFTAALARARTDWRASRRARREEVDIRRIFRRSRFTARTVVSQKPVVYNIVMTHTITPTSCHRRQRLRRLGLTYRKSDVRRTTRYDTARVSTSVRAGCLLLPRKIIIESF